MMASAVGVDARAGADWIAAEITGLPTNPSIHLCAGHGSSMVVAAPDIASAHSGLSGPADEDLVASMLVIQRSPAGAGQRFLLPLGSTLAGRHPDAGAYLDHVTVSRRHAEFHRQPDGVVTVRDLGSLNGTYLNRVRIEKAMLSGGDEIQLGQYRLVFLPGPQPVGHDAFRVRPGTCQGRRVRSTPPPHLRTPART